jgi:CHAD domain-containing protein
VLSTSPEFAEFVLADEAGAPGELPRIDDPRFVLTRLGPARTVRRTWLDTFDWRLYRAGLTLEHRTGRGAAELVLTGRDGELAAADQAPGRLRWPCLVDELPAGPLREHLAGVAGIRALLALVRATSVLSERRAVNADDKTIAVLTTDRMTLATAQPAQSKPAQSKPAQSKPAPAKPDLAKPAPAHPQPPARVTIRPLRGYQAQAARLAGVLATAPGVSQAVRSGFELALTAAGRTPRDYSGKIDVEMAGDMPAALAVTTVLVRLLDTAEANVDGTIRDIDTEFLHDLRVAVRRTRSVLKLTGSVLPGSVVSRYRPEFKWLGDMTTPTRDLDVYLLGYSSMAAALIAGTSQELAPFHDHLRRQRASAQRQLASGLRSVKFSSLTGRWRHDLDEIISAPARRPKAAGYAASRIARAHQRVLRDGGVIDAASPPAALHDLRKRCKELRYLLEVFAPLHSPAEQWRAVNELKALQDCLGEYQDAEVQQLELRDFAAQMLADRSAPAPTLLAMGEIAAGLAVRQRTARSEFAGRFADFASPHGQARIAALTAAAS